MTARRLAARLAAARRLVKAADALVDRDFELTTTRGLLRFRVCSRRGGMLRCLHAPNVSSVIPETLLLEALEAGTVRRV